MVFKRWAIVITSAEASSSRIVFWIYANVQCHRNDKKVQRTHLIIQLDVDLRRCLVHDDDLRPSKDCTSQCHELPFASAE